MRLCVCAPQAAEEFSPERVEQAMARLHPLCRSTQFIGQRGESAPCWRSIRQHLQHHCADGATPAAPPTAAASTHGSRLLQMLRHGQRCSASFIGACLKACR